jgi:hypothetical protein
MCCQTGQPPLFSFKRLSGQASVSFLILSRESMTPGARDSTIERDIIYLRKVFKGLSRQGSQNLPGTRDFWPEPSERLVFYYGKVIAIQKQAILQDRRLKQAQRKDQNKFKFFGDFRFEERKEIGIKKLLEDYTSFWSKITPFFPNAKTFRGHSNPLIKGEQSK